MLLNHVIVSGNLTRDPEVRSIGADKSLAAFTIAHNNKYKTHDGETKEEVSFIDCEAWGKQGEVAAQYLTKGSLAVIEGRLKQDNWTDKDGQKRSKLKLVADRVHLPPRPQSLPADAAHDGRDDQADSRAPASAAPASANRAGRPSPAPAARPATRTATAPTGDDPPF